MRIPEHRSDSSAWVVEHRRVTSKRTTEILSQAHGRHHPMALVRSGIEDNVATLAFESPPKELSKPCVS
jgi:hypothetical protein